METELANKLKQFEKKFNYIIKYLISSFFLFISLNTTAQIIFNVHSYKYDQVFISMIFSIIIYTFTFYFLVNAIKQHLKDED